MNDNLSKQNILIVDDAPANIKVLIETLMPDYEISVATNGPEALEIAASKKPPDLILLDIMMPGMDGFEVCSRLKALKQTQNIPVIFITALNEEKDEARGFELGTVDYITKPINPLIVKARVRTHLELKRYRDHLEELVKERTAELTRVNQQLKKDIAERIRAEEQLKKARDWETQLLEISIALSYELNLDRLLSKIMDTTTELLSADRCTLFMFDEKSNELWSRMAQGLEIKEIRLPGHFGIAGSVFTTGETINIPDAYADDRFNPEVDNETGYRTRSILCMPVKNKKGRTIGVAQVLNKKGGHFTATDEKRLAAFSAQASVALENAKLFEDVLNMKNYDESMLESMSNGMISLDVDKNIVKCNTAALKILHEELDGFTGPSADLFFKANSWVPDSIDRVMETKKVDLSMDADLILADGAGISVNLTIVPLINIQKELIGSLLVLEDITSEKRLKSTISRYMTKEVADKLLEGGDAVLGGQIQEATILFSDIRNFTTITENIGPQETVSLLNAYFSITVDIIFRYKGILDKYIGDAIMAVFGAPFSSGNDPDRAVKTAIDIQVALEKFNRERIADAKNPISIGIGINTDKILSGNIGSLKRMDYTVIGDGVNLASRLEGANKVYGTNILISEFTCKRLTNSYICREMDLILVKGKIKPVRVYQMLDYYNEESFPHMNEVLGLFQEGLTLYRRRDWVKGIDCFSQALSLNEKDAPSRLYLNRCRHFAKNPPADDWDNVWVMETK